jgi:hypothetical protein
MYWKIQSNTTYIVLSSHCSIYVVLGFIITLFNVCSVGLYLPIYNLYYKSCYMFRCFCTIFRDLILLLLKLYSIIIIKIT